MIFKNFSDFQKSVAPMPHRLLALDVGTKTVGVAVSDSQCRMSSPLKTVIKHPQFIEVKELQSIIAEYSVKSLIVGYPLHMNGDEGDRCAYVEKYAQQLSERIGLPILFWDERMSTVSAERFLLDGDMSRAKRKTHIDAVAASVILQSFLDFFAYQR